ncbi:MAG: biotin/lipoyl-binding protein, partial [Kamptonema sp. SIO4C4]|nr:biotin/lipoyl-binding protein [Kamptonema sp. SIO4C4]
MALESKLNDSRPSAKLFTVGQAEFLPPVQTWVNLGGLIVAGTVGAAFLCAGILEYNVTVQASATVRPTGDLRIVEATQAGTVQRIEVQENQQVKAGETIAQLDDTRL